MYAIVQTGGKQYRVQPGDVLRVERLAGEVGDDITLDQVLLVAAEDEFQVGRPLIDGAFIRGQILRQGRARKILVFKKKRRKDYRRLQGHRQQYTALQVKEIRLA
ncbi:50S ribosomal protein L21 [Desulfobacca acetoxidans]|uniref:Large ribosomal subunit protein bL21 n=1 Tax=Desulfobacca acetoxidans (strain ATCC 700848 / DSM 11109 / ASRB2) TaxID=880072 RepID=F2NHN7_DESAR|nr:50S ribosomal protein L21 [Desulfobacca acetoxidans]AEB09224.1 50S ribosomal protein L21 [Desulfobacca acetoxidans DSM 11109]